jgi:outer membrane scaffolding protein for murein synthesis (MipA/OmpV family)
MTLLRIALVSALLAGAGCVHAQAFNAARFAFAPLGRDAGSAGAALLATPSHPGSDERRALLVPAIDYQWANGLFAGTTTGIGWNLGPRPDLNYGVRATADFGRSEGRAAALRGLGDIDPRAEIGGFVAWRPVRSLALVSSLRFGSGTDRDGLVLDVGANASIDVTPSLRAGLSVGATWANGAHLRDWFGVTPAQSAASGYAAYRPGAGARDLTLGASLGWRVSARWTALGLLAFSALQGDARDSPIVRDASGLTAVVTAVYAF